MNQLLTLESELRTSLWVPAELLTVQTPGLMCSRCGMLAKATTLTQRCWENVNTGQSIKMAKWVCTGFKRVHLMSRCEFCPQAEQTGQIATSRTHAALEGIDPPCPGEGRKILANPSEQARQPVLLSYGIIWISLCKFQKGGGKGWEVWHIAIRHRSTRLMLSSSCSQVYIDVNAVFQETA